jgi:rare lipoprotein A
MGYSFFVFFQKPSRFLSFTSEKNIFINDNGLIFEMKTKENTINTLLQEKNIYLTEYDTVIPPKETVLYPGIIITIDRAIKFQLSVDDQIIENYSTEKTIGGILRENNIVLGRLDKISPILHWQPHNNEKIIVTRINIEEKIITEEIAFKTVTKEDAKIGWREKKVEQKGELGKKEIKYSITYKNGQEISRLPLEKNIISEPVTEIIVQGTHMQLGKANTGQGTWYVFQGGMFAASTSLPRGSYARVTNLENGKSVVVQINDYGPQGKGRVIDLDKVAFASIASLGAGIIGVKVEAILN